MRGHPLACRAHDAHLRVPIAPQLRKSRRSRGVALHRREGTSFCTRAEEPLSERRLSKRLGQGLRCGLCLLIVLRRTVSVSVWGEGLSRALLAFWLFAAEVAGVLLGRVFRRRRCAWWAILDEKPDLHAEISLPETRPRRNTRCIACAERDYSILALKLRAKGDSHPEKRL